MVDFKLTGEPMIELRGVTKRFGTFTAVDKVDLIVNEGEFLTLLGPSGCGKTTLLRIMSGLETPDEGCVLLVEWGEPWMEELGGDALLVALSTTPRLAQVTSHGPRSEHMLAQLQSSGQNAPVVMDR